MSSNSTEDDDPCAPDDNLCITRTHLQAVIIVPTLLLFFTLVTLLFVFLRQYCPERRPSHITAPQNNNHHHSNPHHHHHHHHRRQQHHHRHHHVSSHRHTQRPHLQGIDAPPGLNPLEHEVLPLSVQPVQQNVKPNVSAPPQVTTERHHGAFSQVTALPLSVYIKANDAVTLYRGRMDNRDVVLRVLKETATSGEKQHFLNFASFVSALGPHPFLPALLGVVSVQPPLMIVMEELRHRDLLGFLWRCRQVQVHLDNTGSGSSCDMTEKRIFIMAGQVASALDYLHSKGYVHGNVGARSVLVGGDLTVKLWGLGSVYRRTARGGSLGEVDVMEMRKWQAPEVLARRAMSKSSDVWSFGILLYEMVSLGDPPFAELMAAELLQHLQRGKHLSRPPTCSNTLYSIIRSCCHWNPQQRLTVADLTRKLEAAEKSAYGRTVLIVPKPINIERYLREAGYGEAFNYAVL
uniref:tyrosine-protein kinase STYK1-like isoform X1 n=1 Tax=Solea senegalensis TaxID=28829 RepID=UPI001CD908F1|nr:tyrosine-protein kinase STYK1-like isoform X1 [Solea senegalensis]XP_043909047.1 tyrosine-protein kinase STYK1-like isoform X1 [Solea senegalensis]